MWRQHKAIVDPGKKILQPGFLSWLASMKTRQEIRIKIENSLGGACSVRVFGAIAVPLLTLMSKGKALKSFYLGIV